MLNEVLTFPGLRVERKSFCDADSKIELFCMLLPCAVEKSSARKSGDILKIGKSGSGPGVEIECNVEKKIGASGCFTIG